MSNPPMVTVQNVNVPGSTTNVNAEKYYAMREVLLKVLPAEPPGLTQAEMGYAVISHLPQALRPGGKKSMWWLKTVQLDLEAKGLVRRTAAGRPSRWYQV